MVPLEQALGFTFTNLKDVKGEKSKYSGRVKNATNGRALTKRESPGTRVKASRLQWLETSELERW
ncbi:hypothetical protein E2C01_049516 [Portunus trituberculatus]|uniref:Uncharacterized protein n=1 Tax=Portunus trituberculatus TaxID=210409 RepID=A0A5B7GG91_PORTR|nr:hypothetical protein [Portunus trituberculatus]